MPVLLYVVQPLAVLAVVGTLTATMVSGSFLGQNSAASVQPAQFSDPKCQEQCQFENDRCQADVKNFINQCSSNFNSCESGCSKLTDRESSEKCYSGCKSQYDVCSRQATDKQSACNIAFSDCFHNKCRVSQPAPAPSPVPIQPPQLSECEAKCKLNTEACFQRGTAGNICDQEFQSCAAGCRALVTPPSTSPVQPPQPQPFPQPQPQPFGQPGIPDGFSQPGGQPGQQGGQPPAGIPLGGGFQGTGPGGCTSPEECKKYCGQKENQKECGIFFKQFQQAPRSFEKGPGEGPEFGQGEFDEEAALNQAKAQFKRFARGMTQLGSRIKRLQSKKVAVPQDALDAFETLKGIGPKIDSIKTFDELEDLVEQAREAIELLNEKLEGLERLAEYARVKKQAEREIRRVESQLKRLISRAKGNKVEVDDLIKEIEAEVVSLKDAMLRADAAAKSGDAAEVFQILEEEVFGRLGDIGEKFASFEAVVRAPAEIKRIERELNRMASLVKRLKGKKLDVSNLESLLDQMREKLGEFKGLVKQKPLPIDSIIDLVQAVEDLRDQFEEEANDLQGIEEETIVPEFDEIKLPSGLPFGGGAGGPSRREPLPGISQ